MPAPAPLQVHFADEHLTVVEKPAGLLSVPGKGEANQDCVASRVRAMFPHAVGPLTVHRLDMDTSGLIVLGLTAQSQAALSRQFEAREVIKEYEAIVAGAIVRDAGEIDIPIRLDPTNRPRQVIDHVHGKPSRTAFVVIGRDSVTTRLRLIPHTGRTHQLRVHCAAPIALGGLGAPILGDPLYGERASAPRLLLHAGLLEFRHPQWGTPVRIASPTPF